MNSTNVVFDILKNAPIGIKLYCNISGEVTLCGTQSKERLITVETENGEKITLNETGCLVVGKITYTRCILFPTEGDTSWDGWQEALFEEKDLIVKNHDSGKLYLIQNSIDSWYTVNTENQITALPKRDLKQYEFPTLDEKKKFITEITNYYSKL
jgi:hypothetical protein